MTTNSSKNPFFLAMLAMSAVVLFSMAGCKGPVYPMCKNDSHCKIGPAGESLNGVCVNGNCQECAMNSDCQDGKQCVGNVCKSASAETDGDDMDGASGNKICAMDEKTIHFDFDKYDINSSDSQSLDALAVCLRKNATVNVVLEGHTDDRGSSEYNLALGQRRADSVSKYLSNNGVTKERLKTVSYGKEKPADSSSNEEAWAANRRTEIKPQ